jgi:prepilin-type processing-associated H-X9-DG protein
MYKIVGADNAEYGPEAAGKIREWIQQGRINSQTRIKAEGTDDWKTLGEFSEFADLLASGRGAPPVLPDSGVRAGKISGLAIASLVLGVLAWLTFGVTALPGFALGIVALVLIHRSRSGLRGTGLAITGTVLSGVFLLMLPVLAAMLLPALAKAKGRAQTINCMNNMKQLGLAHIMYASENKDHFAAADHWCDALKKYAPEARTYVCPAGRADHRCDYAFNAKLAGLDMNQVRSPNQTVLLFESEGGWNVSGGEELTMRPGRHGGKVGVVFADGHAEMVGESRLATVKWDP